MTGRGQGDAGKKLSAVLDENERMIREIFFDDETVVVRKFGSRENASLRCMMVLIDGMVNGEAANRHIVMPVNECRALGPGEDALETLRDKVISVGEVKTSDDPAALAKAIVGGEAALFIDGADNALIINTRGWQARSVSEPEPERVIRGPREGFVESILINLSMVRRKISTPDLKFRFRTVGARTHTRICLVYHEALANREILRELEERLSRYSLDGALDAEYVEEMIRDAPYNPPPSFWRGASPCSWTERRPCSPCPACLRSPFRSTRTTISGFRSRPSCASPASSPSRSPSAYPRCTSRWWPSIRSFCRPRCCTA